MATLIGTESAYSTWGKCRTAIGNGDTGLSGGGANNLIWTTGFRTTEGNGFVRLDPAARFGFTATFVEYIDPSATFRLKDATTYIVMDQSEADTLVTQTVTLTGPDSFAITADYLTAVGQTVTTTGYFPITAIGLLTPL
jgi:hypothetical protein